MRPQRPLPTVPFVKSRYAEARTRAAAILAAICPGGSMPNSTARWPHRRCGRRTASAWSSVNRLSGATAAVKHPVEPRLAKNFGMLDAHAGTNCGRPARPRAPGKTAPCRVLGPAVFYGSGFAMVAKLLLLIALLAPILTVAAGVLAHRPKKPDRESREDKNKS